MLGSMEGYLLARGILYCLTGVDIAGQAGRVGIAGQAE